MNLPREAIREIVERALREDLGSGDLTTLSVIAEDMRAEAHVVTRETGVVAGLAVLAEVFTMLDPDLALRMHVADGARVQPGDVLVHIAGSARSILSAERVALNFVQRLSGIATTTAHYVTAIGDLPTRVLDTRKTTPGLRTLEKYAVRVGGGLNHRFGLYDAIMLKDNHLALLAGLSLIEAVRQARAMAGPMVRIEVEAESIEQALLAAEAQPDLILLDNMAPASLREVVAAIQGRIKLEASGGITLETIRAVAETGVDYISVGALTHSVRALDLSLEIGATS